MTNVADLPAFIRSTKYAGVGVNEAALPFELEPTGARRALLAADPSYLQSAFDAIEQSHGSVDVYISEITGLGAAALDTLRARFRI